MTWCVLATGMMSAGPLIQKLWGRFGMGMYACPCLLRVRHHGHPPAYRGRGSIAGVVSLLLGLMAIAGCRPAPPPENLRPYAWVDDATAIRVLAERSKAVRSMSAEVGLTLTRPDGQSVQFDGAMATRAPGDLRLQTFKFGRTVFDLTLTNGGMFVKTMDDPGRREKIVPASRSAARFAREWSMFTGGLFEQSDLAISHDGPRMTVRRPLSDGRTVVCSVDKATLTPRRYAMLDPDGVERFTLATSAYQMFGEIPCATRLLATSEQGTIDIEIRDMELNVEHAERAFIPPEGAERLEE